MSTFNQGTPTVNTTLNTSNCSIFGNTSTGTALSVQQLGTGSVMNVATSTGTSALFVTSAGNVGVGTNNPTSTGAGTLLHVYDSSSNNPTLVVDASAGSGQARLHMKAGQGSTFRANRMDFFSNTNIIWTQITDYNQGGANDLSFLSAGKGYTSGGVMVLTQGGNVGIGTTNPTSLLTVGDGTNTGATPLGVYNIYNGTGGAIIQNLSTGTGAVSSVSLGDSANNNRGGIALFGSGYTASAQYRTGGTYVYNNIAGGVTVHAEAANSNVYIATAGSERMRITGAGNVGIGLTNPSFQFQVNGTGGNLTTMCAFYQGSNQCMAILNGDLNAGWNSAGTVLYVSKINYSGRSINAYGTINASGADYAEYMTKTSDFTIKKGDVVGVNSQGLLTNVFADSVTFVVKSTDPSYVGGDVWGNEEALGLTKPKEGDANYQTALAQFNAALETARARVDRIAFAGQVPVNVLGATPGQYIVPVANSDGSIGGQAVSNPTFEQYTSALGKVIKVLTDGRAQIIVKVV